MSSVSHHSTDSLGVSDTRALSGSIVARALGELAEWARSSVAGKFLVLPLNIRGETAGTITCYYRTPKTKGREAEL